jgi:3-oxoacyl-[acyl-carrier protein] reductase
MAEKRIAMITGAAQGIGRAIANRLALDGLYVVLTDINGEMLREAENEIGKRGKCEAVELDVSSSKQVAETIESIEESLERIDILVNNAGIITHEALEDITDEVLQKVFAVNYFGTLYCCREVVPSMKANRYGKIVNISSITAKRGDNTTSPCYGSSKGAVAVFTKSLARHLGPFGINVNAVAPHAIMTPFMAYWDEDKKRGAAESIPVRRLGTPEDVAAAVSFLVSDDSSYITGQILNIDGGHFMDS